MKTIVFIGTHKSGSSREAIGAAKRLGYYTILFTELARQINQRNEYDDVDSMIYCKIDKVKLLNKMKELQEKSYEICAVISMIDPYCGLASELAETLGLHHFTIEAIKIIEDKHKSREALIDTHYIPKYKTFDLKVSISKSDLEPLLPAIMKYTHSQGSKDVYLINNYEEFLNKFKQLKNKYHDGTIIIEEYLNGPQYIVETLVIDGVVHIIAVVEQEVTYSNGHFIVTGYSLLLNLAEDFNEKLKKSVEDIIACHGLVNGPSHLEMRYVNEEWKLIEINPRISGTGMNKMLETGIGINLVEETIKLALQIEVDLKPKFKLNTYSHYVILNKTGRLEKLTGRNRAENCKGVKYIFIKPKKGRILTPPISMGDRYAYVIATGEDEREARDNAKYAASKITFHLSTIEE